MNDFLDGFWMFFWVIFRSFWDDFSMIFWMVFGWFLDGFWMIFSRFCTVFDQLLTNFNLNETKLFPRFFSINLGGFLKLFFFLWFRVVFGSFLDHLWTVFEQLFTNFNLNESKPNPIFWTILGGFWMIFEKLVFYGLFKNWLLTSV